MSPHPVELAIPDPDLLDPAFYVNPYETYAYMRDHAPVWWDPVNEIWGIFGYDEVVEVERNKKVFINSDQVAGGYRPKTPADPSIIGLDDPQHTVRRVLVSRRFTPRAVDGWEPHIRSAVNRLLDDALAHGDPIEVVDELAAPLPAMMIGYLLGFGEDMWPSLKSWSERTIALGGGPRSFNDDGIAALMEFRQACTDLYNARKDAAPIDDVMGVWIQAEKDGLKDGEEFGIEQILSDCLLLLDGGSETTRTVIGRTLLELAQRPDQWKLLQDGADLDVAVEEFIRWVTPIHNMTRACVEPYDIAGQTIEPGQQAMFMYASANRDPKHFANPETFDVTRNPNPHIAFGFGTHFCLGASLARIEIKILFEELLRRIDTIELAEDPVDMATAFVHGLKQARVLMTPV